MVTAFKSTQVGDSLSIKENVNARDLLYIVHGSRSRMFLLIQIDPYTSLPWLVLRIYEIEFLWEVVTLVAIFSLQ